MYPMFYVASGDNKKTECEGNPCDVVQGGKFQYEPDIDLRNLGIRFGRHYQSQASHDQFDKLGYLWRHSYSSRIGEGEYPYRVLNKTGNNSVYYLTKQQACESGWNQIKTDAYRGLLVDTDAVYQSDVCQIEQNGEIQAYLDIQQTIPVPLSQYSSQSLVTVTRADGTEYRFQLENNEWVNLEQSAVILQTVSGGWKFTDQDSTVDTYTSQGRIVSSTTIQGLTTAFSYDAEGALNTVTGPYGHILTFSYDSVGRIESVATPIGDIDYLYDADSNLEYVEYPDGTTRRYHYEDTNHLHHLTGITDERGIRYATWAYDAYGRATLSEHAGGVERVTLTYNPNATTTVQTSTGASRTYSFAVNQGEMDITSITGDLCPTCPNGDRSSRTYTSDGYLSGYTDWSDSVTRLGSYDNEGQVGCRVEGITLSDNETGECAFDLAAPPVARRADYVYDPRFHNMVTTETAPSVFTP